MGYRDARVKNIKGVYKNNQLRVRRSQQHENITIWGTESGLQWKPRLGFDPEC